MKKLNTDQKQRVSLLIKWLILPLLMCLTYYIAEVLIIGKYVCTFRLLTGLYCPGCGGQRMIHSLLNGDIYKAFRYNQLMFMLLPFIMVYYSYNIFRFIKIGELHKYIGHITLILMGLAIVFTVLRNISTLSWLAPT